MRVLVSGAAGFVGRNFMRRLNRDGVPVYGFDITEGLDALDVFADDDDTFDLLIHCAANVGGRTKIDGDPLWIARNLAIDEAMFRWAVRTNTRVLYFSSSAAYPTWRQARGETLPLNENALDVANLSGVPDNTYGWSKMTGEYLAHKAREAGANVHVVRPFSGYGTDQGTDYPFGAFIARALAGEDPFEVWGDGHQARDFIHIDDIVEACLRIVEADEQRPVNLCTGRSTSFLELARLVTSAVGYEPQIVTHPDKPTGVYHRVGSPVNLHRFHTPQVTLEQGIRRALDGAL